jgi:hypothetical protein
MSEIIIIRTEQTTVCTRIFSGYYVLSVYPDFKNYTQYNKGNANRMSCISLCNVFLENFTLKNDSRPRTQVYISFPAVGITFL